MDTTLQGIPHIICNHIIIDDNNIFPVINLRQETARPSAEGVLFHA